MRWSPAPLISSALVLSGLLTSSASAAEERRPPQYRVLRLTDGRTLTAEILSTEPTGLLLRTPQGESLISFEVLLDMAPTDATAYESQADWVVYVAVGEALQTRVLDMLAAVPGLSAHAVGSPVNGVDASAAQAALACKGDGQCIADATSSAQWMWVLTAAPGDPTPALNGHLNLGPTRARGDLTDLTDNQLWLGMHTALGLRPPTRPPPAPAPKAGTKTDSAGSMSTSTVTGLSFIPLPGIPSAAQGDWGRAALAWAVVLPATGVFAAAALSSQPDDGSGDPSAFAVIGGGYYVSTVFANQITGMASQKRTLTVGPTAERSGAQVTLHAAF
jgi:hypothetical protein